MYPSPTPYKSPQYSQNRPIFPSPTLFLSQILHEKPSKWLNPVKKAYPFLTAKYQKLAKISVISRNPIVILALKSLIFSVFHILAPKIP